MPDAIVRIDSETSPEVFEKYGIKPGEVFVLVESTFNVGALSRRQRAAHVPVL
jgi:hypothetical protein